jgi:N4-gp56 family major capsid protein
MVISTELRTDFKNLATFLATADYPRQQSVLEAELGSCDEVRLVMTSEAFKDATVSPPVYSNMLFAANAYGRIMIDDQSMEMIIKPLGAGQDPLNQRQTMGWKGRLGSVILDDSWAVNLRSTKG